VSERRSRRGIRSSRRIATCYHEAGHCLARWYFGHSFDRVLVPATDEVQRGAQTASGGEEAAPETLARAHCGTVAGAEQELVHCYAGIMVEARYCGVHVGAAMLAAADDDMARAQAVLREWFPDDDAREAAALLAESRAVALARSKPGWAAITAMADALLERGELSWEEAEPLFATAYGHKQPHIGAWHDAWPPSLDMIRAGQTPGIEAL